jgi:hypothetical protein
VILEHRTYTFKPGTLDKWMQKYDAEGLAIQRRHLNTFVGAYTTEIGHLHQIVLMWAYDSLADREARRARMAADPDWKKYIAEIWAMEAIQTQEVKIMNPAPFNPQR